MQVTAKFQGIIADMVGRKTERIDLPDGATIDDLFATLTSDDEMARSVLKQTRAFIDGQQAERATPLAEGAEVIFMRPIAGGSWEGALTPSPLAPCAGLGVRARLHFEAVEPGGRSRPPVVGSG